MKEIPKTYLIYEFGADKKPVEIIEPGELVLVHTEDALGGQIKSEKDSLSEIDWSKVDPATGPIYVKGAEKGDTLVVDILDIEIPEKGICLVVPGYGALRDATFNPKVKIVSIKDGYIFFNGLRLRAHPMIGTIGVAPYGSPIATGVPYKHGGNLDCKEITRGAKLYLPVATEGALFALGDLHALQADGELCVASVEIEGKVLLRFGLIKNKQAEWPIVETNDHFSILVSEESLDKAAEVASHEAVKALMKAQRLSFEEAYILASLKVDLEINQVVDPKKGVRAVIPKELVALEHLLTKSF